MRPLVSTITLGSIRILTTIPRSLKLHEERRPSSMKSDVIRKRSRHDARRATSSSETPSTSPRASRRTSPTPPTTSPTLPVSVSVPADFASPAGWANYSASPVEQMSMDPMPSSPGPFSLSYSVLDASRRRASAAMPIHREQQREPRSPAAAAALG